MGFGNFVAVFGCSIVTNSTSKMFGFPTASSYFIFNCSIGFDKLEVALGCLTAADIMSPLFDAS